MSSQPSDLLSHQQRQAEREQRRSAQERVQELLQRCARLLDDGGDDAYVQVATLLADENGILRTLERLRTKPLEEHTPEENTEGWHWAELDEFVSNPGTVRRAARGEGGEQRKTDAQRKITRVVHTCTRLAECMGAVQDAYEAKAEVEGWATKIGEWLQDEEMDVGDPVSGISEQAGALKTLHCGPTGLGKSTGTEAEAEDYLMKTLGDDGRDFKLLDLIGFRQGENWVGDIPQQQDALRERREELELPASFEEMDEASDREIEILVPLTEDLTTEELPYDVDREQFSVRPFTIPASDLRKPVLVSLIMSRLSDSEEQTIRAVYDEVADSHSDWSLPDLADAIRSRRELSDKHKAKAIDVLRSLQSEGFIRTAECEYTLDWPEIFTSTDRTTVFSQALCESKLSQLITFAYLADSIVMKRQRMPFLPDCVCLMRELWEVAPHKRRQSFDSRAAAVQEAIGQILMKLFRQNRHIGVHVIADTQAPSDLLKSIREMFNRYVVYGADKDTVDDIFSWTQNNRWKGFWSTLSPKAGEAGIVGQVQPAVDNKNIEFISPVRYAPPSHHHFDNKVDDTGWHARVEYIEQEVLREPAAVDGVDWPDRLPEELEISSSNAEDEEGGPDPRTFPVDAFAERCLAWQTGVATRKDKIYAAFNAFATEYGHDEWDFDDRGTTTTFGSRIGSYFEEHAGKRPDSTDRNGGKAYRDLALTPEGEQYLEERRGSESSAAEPIRGDD